MAQNRETKGDNVDHPPPPLPYVVDKIDNSIKQLGIQPLHTYPFPCIYVQ